MVSKTTSILYWVTTILFGGFMLVDGLSGILRVEQGKEIMIHLGFPIYFLTITGVAKVLGALALFQPRFRILKEWAYAGFTINFIGAFLVRIFTHDSVVLVVSPLLFLIVMFVTYGLWKKRESALLS